MFYLVNGNMSDTVFFDHPLDGTEVAGIYAGVLS